MVSPTARRRAPRWGALSLTAVVGTAAFGVAALAGGTTARADVDDVTFNAITSAYGLEFRLENPSIPTGIPIEGSGPTSQARLSSLNQSDAFASLPYPGDTGANITGVVSAVSGIPLPPYPFYIQSRNGSPPPKTGAFPGINLTAESTDNLSTSKATAFTEAAGYVAESTIRQAKEGAVTAESTAIQNGLQIGGTLTLSGVVSSAKAALDTAGKLTTSSSLTVTRFIAPALDLTLPPTFSPPNSEPIPNPFAGQVLQGPDLRFADGTFFVTLPGAGAQEIPISEEAATAAFEGIGIEMSFQDPVRSDTGIVGSTLVLKSVLPAPPENQLYTGETPITFTIGRTAASIEGDAVAAAAAPPAGPPAAPGAAPAGGQPVDATAPGVGVGVVPDPALGAGGAPIAAPGALPGGVAGAPPGTGAAPTVALTPAGRSDQFVSATSGVQLESVAPFYFVLIGVGLVGLMAGQILRYAGVRSAWRS